MPQAAAASPQRRLITVDFRPRGLFAAAHHPDAARVDLAMVDEAADLHVRLPPRTHVPLVRAVCMAEDQERVIALFKGYTAMPNVLLHEHVNWAQLVERGDAIAGASSSRLWRPNPCLEASEFDIVESAASSRTALDLGCGSGRCSVFLALRGWSVTAIDRDPKVLARLARLATSEGVVVDAHRANVTASKEAMAEAFALPSSPIDLVVCSRFMPPRHLLPVLAQLVPAGAFLCVHHFLLGSLSRSGLPFKGGDEHVWSDVDEVLKVFGYSQGFEPPVLHRKETLEDGVRTAVSYIARKSAAAAVP